MRRAADAIRPLRVLRAAAIVVPAGLFLFAALESRQWLFRDAEETVRANAAILQEHALKVLETQDLVIQELDARLAGRAWSEIRGSPTLHAVLARIVHDLKQIQSIQIIDRNGDVAVSSASHPPPAVNVADTPFFRLQREGDRGTFVSGPGEGAAAGEAAYELSRRIRTPEGLFNGIIQVAADPLYLTSYYTDFLHQPGQQIVLARADGTVLAQMPKPENAKTLPPLQSSLTRAMERDAAWNGISVVRFQADDGERIGGFQKVGGYPVYVMFALSTDTILERWHAIAGAFGIGVLIVSVSLFLTTLSALRRTRDAVTLQEMLRKSNEVLERRVEERTADLSAANDSLQGVNAALRDAVAERELLLREIHHRVKNNLQVIISLLNLQAHAAGPPLADGFNESLRRIRTMARIHEMIYSSDDVTGVDFAVYLRQLCGELVEFYGIAGRISCRVGAESVRFDLDTATPLAMIVNEVLANACKHAFPDGAKGEIAIGLSRDGDRIELTVEDSGIGLPENLAEASRKSMGMRLIETLSARLDADYRFETSAGRTGGSLFRLSFVHPERAVPDTRR